jgi:hypothetical protein
VDQNLGQIIVIGIAVVGVIAWLAGLSVMARAVRERRARAEQAATRFDVEEAAAGGTIVGEAEVDGRPEELSEKLARLLARDAVGPFGPVKIVGCDRNSLVFEAGGASPGSGGYAPAGVYRGRFRFSPSGSKTRVEYAVEAPSRPVLIAFGWLFIALGLIALVGGCWAMFTYVLPNPNPSVRGQAIQMVQIVHFLWPPFLFAALSRQPARWISAHVDALVNNLPYS